MSVPRSRIGQRAHVVGREHCPRRVMRAVDHQQPRARRDRRLHLAPVHCERPRIQRHMHGARTGQLDGGLIAVVSRVEHDHLLAGTHHAVDGVEDRLRGTTGHGDLDVGIDLCAIAAQRLAGDGLAQRRRPGHRRILVVALAHRPIQRLDQPRRHREIREPLAQVDRLVLSRQLRHHSEDSGADFGQLGGGHGHAARSGNSRGLEFSSHPSGRPYGGSLWQVTALALALALALFSPLRRGIV